MLTHPTGPRLLLQWVSVSTVSPQTTSPGAWARTIAVGDQSSELQLRHEAVSGRISWGTCVPVGCDQDHLLAKYSEIIIRNYGNWTILSNIEAAFGVVRVGDVNGQWRSWRRRVTEAFVTPMIRRSNLRQFSCDSEGPSAICYILCKL